MFIFYILFLLVIAYVFALKAASKIAAWVPWLLFTVFMLSILSFVIDHWIISIIILFGAAAIFGMTIETEEDGKTIKPEPEGLKFYQRKVFKAWVVFIVFFSIMVGLANGPFAKHSDNQGDKKEKVSSSSSTSSKSESSSSTSATSSSSSKKESSKKSENPKTYNETDGNANGSNFTDEDYRNESNIGKSVHLSNAKIARVDKKNGGLWIETINDENNPKTTHVQAVNLASYKFKVGDVVDIKATLQGMKKSMVTFDGDTDKYPTIWISDINAVK